MPSFIKRAALLSLTLTLLLGVQPNTAHADSTQLCRSISSIALAPTDILFSPYIAARDLWYGMSEWDDPQALRIGTAPLGYAYLNAMQVGGASLRVISGIFEFPLGLATLFREGSERPLFKSQDETEALYSEDFGPCPVRIGSSYQTIYNS